MSLTDDNLLKDFKMAFAIIRTPAKASSLHLGQHGIEDKLAPSISCNQCSLNIQHHMGSAPPV